MLLSLKEDERFDGPLAPLGFYMLLVLVGACAWGGCEVDATFVVEVDASFLSV